jgi:hypothetical protein
LATYLNYAVKKYLEGNFSHHNLESSAVPSLGTEETKAITCRVKGNKVNSPCASLIKHHAIKTYGRVKI